jgi:3-oxoacyl-(acyl-carrier-protein) synthase
MSVLTTNILSTAIVTPFGIGADCVFLAEKAAEPVPVTVVLNPETGRKHRIALAPQNVAAHLAREPRLRRASVISMLAATTAREAITKSGIAPGPRTALVVGVSNGCAHYTRRFYEQIVKSGANTASPLLFPETVHNAPASHLAAMMKLDGATYTLIGDSTVGLQALHFAAQLIAIGDADHVIVAAAEELDWILAEGHHVWRLTSPHGTCRPHSRTGTLLAEGAAAVVLGKGNAIAKLATVPGRSVMGRGSAAASLIAVTGQLDATEHDWIVDGANGTWVDSAFLAIKAPRRLSPKGVTGEAVGASALQQVVMAVELLHQTKADNALVAALGWNQNAAAAKIYPGGA